MPTHQTAIVVIPPEDLWEPIQAIRRQHDRHIRRWMPHINLVYAFRPREQFERLAGPLRRAISRLEPFEIRLAEFRFFEHSPGRCTIWLAPEPPGPLIRLQSALEAVVPDCDEQSRRSSGFTPHLSLGQVRGRRNVDLPLSELQKSWRPLDFRVSQVCLIWRDDPPDDVFRVDRTIPLGALS